MDQKARIGRFVMEAFVIVSSILLAFGIDAGWDARQERLEEAEILAGLEREFTDYRDQMQRGVDQQSEMLDAMATILEAIHDGGWTSTSWSEDEAIGRLLTPPTSDLGNGVRDALVQAGRLELLTDPVLRERLAQWPAHYGELVDDQTFSRDLVMSRVIPYLTSRGVPLSAMLVAGTMIVDSPADAWPVPQERLSDDPAAMRTLLNDPDFKSLVEVRYSYWHHAGLEYRATLEMAEEILGLIREAA